MIFPNPSKGNITLSLNAVEKGTSVAIIYDNMGRMVRKVSFIKYYNSIQQQIQTFDLQRGVYFINVQVGRYGSYRTRFIKQ